MEVHGKRSVNHGSKLLCNPCEDDGNNSHAKGFCLQCEEYMCTTCFDKHKRRRISRNHTLVPVHEAVLKTGLNEPEQFEKCEQHLNEIIKFYCPKHEQVGCGDCMILVHKSCKVEYIRDIAKTFKDSREFKELVNGAEKCQTEANTVFIAIKCNKKQARDIKDKFIKDVKKVSDSIISKINDLKDSVIKQGESMKTEDIENLNNLEKENEEFMKQMTGFVALFDSQIDQPNKLFVNYVQEKANLKRLKETYEGIREKNSIKNYQFKPDANLERAVNGCKELGGLKQMEQDADVKDVHAPIVASKPSAESKHDVAAPQNEPLIERKKVCSNIAIDGEYLSYDHNGTDVGLYVYDPQNLNFYFEVEIVNSRQRGEIVIGVVPSRNYPKNLQPGWGDCSVGYNTNDGKLYQGSRNGNQFGPKCNAGDIVGCSCQFVSMPYGNNQWKVVFTMKGKQIGETNLMTFCAVYPAIGLCSEGTTVKVMLDANSLVENPQ